MMASTTTDSNTMAFTAGLDLLVAASQLTSLSGTDRTRTRQRPAVSVPDGQYSYINHSCADDTRSRDIASAASSDGGNVVEPNASSTSRSFVTILMEILSVSITDHDYASIICWSPDGQSFIIADQERFQKEILPTHFRGSLFNSFVRKLNRWGFRRLKKTGHASTFAHDLFIRDQPWLCSTMKCQSKPNFKKVSAKVKDDARQQALDAARGFAISASDDLHAAATSTNCVSLSNNTVASSDLHSNCGVLRPTPVDVTNIASSSTNLDEQSKRELLLASVSHVRQLQRKQMLYPKDLS